MQRLSSPKQTWPAAGLLLLLLLLLAGPGARAQTPAWQSAMALSQTSGSTSLVRALTSDAGGSIYLTGAFTGTVTFGSATLTSAGGKDVFIAKWDLANTRFVWAQRAGGTSDDEAFAVAVAGGNIYLTGAFNSDTALFGTTTLTNNSPGANQADVFVAKLTDVGSTAGFVWGQRAGGTGSELALSMAVRGANVYIAGQFNSIAATFGAQVLPNAGNSLSTDAFVAKLIDAGTTASFAWTQRAGGADNDRGQFLDVAGTSVYVGGYFNGTAADFGSTLLSSAGQTDAFVSKLTDAGTTSSFVWTQQLGSTGFDAVSSLLVNGNTLYVGGTFSNTVRFGGTTLNAVGATDAFVTKLIDAGATSAFVWAASAGGTGTEGVSALALQGSSLLVAGLFSSPSLPFGGTTLLNNSAGSTNDIFIAKLADAGSTSHFEWAAQHASTQNYDYATSLVVRGTTVYAAGYVNPPAAFGSFTISSPANNLVGFLASLTDPTLTATTAARDSFAFALAPNPAHASASLTLPAVPGATTATLTLLDALGRAVRTRPATPGTRTDFDLSGLAPGLYALRATAGAATATQRLVVE
ncbi:MAG: T9SS type A sorting domain-containing protein [Bacteroidota bacterium]|nr:T9SS type A sorting domain-containing protein [Bacteroidota bacterium]